MDTKAKINDDVKAIRKVGEEFFAGVNTGDLERRMATMEPDVVIMPPDRPSIVGTEELWRLSRDYAATFDEKCSVAYTEIEIAGDWGFAQATVTGTRTSKADGVVEPVDLKNLWIFKRHAGGEWKFWRIMFNRVSPSPE